MSQTLMAPMSPPHTNEGVWRIFSVEALSSIGAIFLGAGVFFYTQHRLGWNLIANLSLAAGQGAAYALGALLAGRVAKRMGRGNALIALYLLMVLMSGVGLILRDRTWLILPLLAFTFFLSMSWPMLESLASAGLDAHRLSRRIGTYNLVWAGTAALAIAVEGILIERWPLGVFLIPLAAHLACAALMWHHSEPPPARDPRADPPPPSPEPALAAQRALALWLSRIALPATYVVQYSLMAMMPSLPVLRPLSAAAQTLIGSVWMAGRWIIFLIMGMTHIWHARPRLLLAAVTAMGVAFFGVTIRLSPWFGASNFGVDLIGMIFWQLVLGAAVGIIYYASLYFGMVLSEGSTEHGGYHEALIGLGSILGPGVAAMATVWWPGRLNAGLTAVGIVITLSILGAGAATLRHRKTP